MNSNQNVHSVSLVDKAHGTNFPHHVLLGLTTVAFFELLLASLIPTQLDLLERESPLTLALWELLLLSMRVAIALVFVWSTGFGYNELFTSKQYFSDDGNHILRVRTSRNCALEDRQHWLLSATSVVSGLSVSIDVMWLWVTIINYTLEYPEFVRKEDQTNIQAYIATLWLQTVSTVCLMALLLMMWNAVWRLVKIQPTSSMDLQAGLLTIPTLELEEDLVITKVKIIIE